MQEITIDVRGFSDEKKKRVQDAFFRLGIRWFLQGDSHQCLWGSVEVYTNKDTEGEVGRCIMWSTIKDRAPTHTYSELMLLAGMAPNQDQNQPVNSLKTPANSTSDGSTASYYELPEGATELQDLISHRDMNSQIGEIFRSCYRYGLVSHSDKMRDAKKIRFYAQAEVERLEKLKGEAK